jgi:hypothetical protein
MAFNCYIDETGDDGINTGGTRWFILGAVIVSEDIDFETSCIVPNIKRALNRDDRSILRWSKIRSHDKRLRICSELIKQDWECSCVLSDKNHPKIINARGINQKWYLYFYLTRFLLERLSWYARDHSKQKARLIFEKRDMSYEALGKYLELLYNQKTEISWEYLDWQNFKVIPKGESRMLQVVDLVIGALSDGFEYTPLINLEPRYILDYLIDRFYRQGENLFSYGLKFLPVKDPLVYYKNEYSWLKKLSKSQDRGSHNL